MVPVSRAACRLAGRFTTHKFEKLLESWESSHRSNLAAQTSCILERVDDIQSAQMRKQAERLEELLEFSTNRSMKKTDDVGVDVKKELQGFAQRLHTKIITVHVSCPGCEQPDDGFFVGHLHQIAF
mmetsp:Transcript_23050/g.78404  ORF Transcript_23050/g.78404 Transcript_23050/m.78404 type:complete len:126 (+) Transcript_23050:332-709(+)